MELREQAKEFKADALGALRPTNLAEAMRFAQLLADSTLVPKDYRDQPGNVLVAITMGAEVGLAPMQAIQNIAVINGRPSLWGDAMLGVCRNHREWGGIEETVDDSIATCKVTRLERIGGRVVPRETTRSFTMEEAKRAGLTNKDGPWKQYPRRMLQMRARAFALRDAFTDVLKGLHSADEMSDMIEVVSRDVTPAAEASAANESSPTAAPKSGAAALREKLTAKKESMPSKTPSTPPPALTTERIQVFLDSYKDAEFTDDLAAIRRDIKAVWDTWSEAEQSAVTQAAEAAKARLAQES